MYIIKIDVDLTTLNDFINACYRSRFVANKIKQQLERSIILTLSHECKRIRVDELCDFNYVWYRSNKRTDPSNVAFAVKFVEDALIKIGVLSNDSAKIVNSISHNFVYGSKTNYVILEIKKTAR